MSTSTKKRLTHPEPSTTGSTSPALSSEHTSTNDDPTYNLKAVVNETGLKPDTLRAWERRYGVPSPDRTSGGHRLYSQRDIDMLKWLISRQDEGLSISRAAKLWHRLEAAGRNPLTEEPYATAVPTPPTAESPLATPPFSQLSASNGIEQTRTAWINACLDFDERTAEHVLAQAFAIFPTETVCFDVLQKGLAEIGVGWYEGHITVQQEHFASALAIRRLEALMASTPPPTRNGRILATCPPEERHTFSLLMASLFLRRAGWDVIYLGANVPLDRLTNTIATTKPHLVILSAQTLYTASTMLPMSILLHKENISSAYGGAVFNFFPQLRRYMPGHFLGEQLQSIATATEKLLVNQTPLPTHEVAPLIYQRALEHFKGRQLAIEAKVWQLLETAADTSYLKNANKELAQNITAALTFGDMSLLSSNMEWVHGLLINFHYRMPEQAMAQYITAYRSACAAFLDEQGAPILEWLDAMLISQK